MLKPQDCIILLKLIANSQKEWSQRQLADSLAISLGEINAGIKRLLEAGLLRKDGSKHFIYIIRAAEEFLIYSVKYLFPGKPGEYTRGIATGIGASLFHNKIASSNADFLPVWPDAQGEQQGVALKPIYHSVPQALRNNPDQGFYELLAIIDVIRSGRARERNIAVQLLKDKLENEK